MLFKSLLFLLGGIFALLTANALPAIFFFTVFFIILLIARLRSSSVFILIFFFLGLLWTNVFLWQKKHAIEQADCTQTELIAKVTALPVLNRSGTRFLVRDVQNNRLMALFWRHPNFVLRPEQTIRLKVTLASMALLPTFFDQKNENFSRGVVCEGEAHSATLLEEKPNWSFASFRFMLQQRLRDFLHHDRGAGIIEAVLLGTRERISLQEKKLFQETGTSHLIAISGLHVGMVSAAVFGIMRLLRAFFPISNSMTVWAVFSTAFFYAMLAGFSHPVLRAVVMIFAFLLGMLQRRNHSSADRLGLALFLVLLCDPVSFLFLGFWLSFIAVGFLILISLNQNTTDSLFRTQVLMSMALIPVTLFFFHKVSLGSILANLIAIPVFSLVTVPAAFVGTGLLFFSGFFSSLSFKLSGLSIKGLLVLFDWLHHQSWNSWALPKEASFDVLLGVAAILLFLYAPLRIFRWQSLILFLPLLIRLVGG